MTIETRVWRWLLSYALIVGPLLVLAQGASGSGPPPNTTLTAVDAAMPSAPDQRVALLGDGVGVPRNAPLERQRLVTEFLQRNHEFHRAFGAEHRQEGVAPPWEIVGAA